MGKKSRLKSINISEPEAVLGNVDTDSISLPDFKLGIFDRYFMLVLAALVAVALFPAALGGFVWDDRAFTEALPVMNVSGLASIWFSPSELPSEGHYWPITYTTFWFDHKLWGYDPLPFHVFNIVVHAVNSTLVFLLLRRLAVPGAWLAAAVFAVHPVHVEPVAWVIGRKDLLATMFCLCLLLVWIRFRENSRPDLWRYALALMLFVAALFSKSTIVALPLMFFVWEWWKGGRITARHVAWIVPFFIIGSVYTYMDYAFYQAREQVDFNYSLLDRIMLASQAFWFYIIKLVWPTELSIIYPHWKIGLSSLYSWLSLFGALGLVGVLWRVRHKTGKAFLAGLAFFVILLAPVFGFIDYGYMQFAYAADRYQYLASLGVIAILCSLAVMVADKLPRVLKTSMVVVAAAVLVAFGYLSWQQSKYYESELTLFSYIASVNPVARGVQNNLSGALSDFHRYEEALVHAYLAIEQEPEGSGGYASAGRAHIALLQYEQAEQVLREGIERLPNDKAIGVNLGETLRMQSRCEEALPFYNRVTVFYPDLVQARIGYGICLFDLNRFEESAAQLQHASTLQATTIDDEAVKANIHDYLLQAYKKMGSHEDVELHLRKLGASTSLDVNALHELGDALRLQGKYEEAIEVYERIRTINPREISTDAWIGQALFDMNRLDEALAKFEGALKLSTDGKWSSKVHILVARVANAKKDRETELENYEIALQLDPNSVEALTYLIKLKIEQDNYEGAEALLRRLSELLPQNSSVHASLGRLLLRLNQVEEGLLAMERAVELDPNNVELYNEVKSINEQVRSDS